jgi:hypothetical protein
MMTAVIHRTFSRAATVVVLSLALLTASVARAEEDPEQSGKHSIWRYAITPVLVVVVVVVAVSLIQAARAPSRDVRPPTAALGALDRALAAARSSEAAYTTRWRAPLHQGRTRVAAVAADRGR